VGYSGRTQSKYNKYNLSNSWKQNKTKQNKLLVFTFCESLEKIMPYKQKFKGVQAVCVCLYVGSCMCLSAHMYTFIWRPEINLRCLFSGAIHPVCVCVCVCVCVLETELRCLHSKLSTNWDLFIAISTSLLESHFSFIYIFLSTKVWTLGLLHAR
jgi:hypothetical protein